MGVIIYPPVGSSTPFSFDPGISTGFSPDVIPYINGSGQTAEDALFTYQSSNLGVGLSSGLLGKAHFKGDSDSTGNSLYIQNLAGTFYAKFANIDPTVNSAYATINGASTQSSASILQLTNGGSTRFSFRHDGFQAFQGGSYIGDNASGGTYGNALKLNNAPSSGGIVLGVGNGIPYGGSDMPQVIVGLSNTYSGTGAPFNRMTAMEFQGTYNQSNGTNESIAIRVASTLTSITGSFTGFDFDPTITSSAATYGIRIRPTTVASGFGLNSTVPSAFVHVGQATALGMAQFKFALGGTIRSSPAAGIFEADNTHLYWTDSGNTRYQLDQQTIGAISPTSVTTVENIIDGTPNTDQTAVGDVTSTFNAGATIAIIKSVRLHSDGKWSETNATTEANSTGTLGISLASGTNGNPMKTCTQGFVRNDAWSWTVGAQIYLSTSAGTFTETPPSLSGQVQRVIGWAVATNIIDFRPSVGYAIV